MAGAFKYLFSNIHAKTYIIGKDLWIIREVAFLTS